MGAGDITGGALGASGAFRGSERWWPLVEAHTHSGRKYDLTPYVQALSTHKALSEPAGRCTVASKPEIVGRTAYDWTSLLHANDWVVASVTNRAGATIPLMRGPIDNVGRTRARGPNGAATTAYSIQARDMGKCLAQTDLTDMRAIVMSRTAAVNSILGMVNDLAGKGLTPGAVVRSILRFAMGAGEYRRPGTTFWRVPPTLAGGDGVQAIDTLDLERVAQDLEGYLSTAASLGSNLPGAGKAWDALTQYANLALNELYLDMLPPKGREIDPNLQPGDWRPSLVLREKPFPIMPGTASWRPGGAANFAWSWLPLTRLDARDLENETLATSDGELTNFWSFISGGVEDYYRDVITDAAFATTSDHLAAGCPRFSRSSVERGGLRRMESRSLYLDPAATSDAAAAALAAAGAGLSGMTGYALYTGWTGLLRDWYALNDRFLSGTLAVSRLVPQVRVGERVQVRAPEYAEEFYVEAVDHTFAVGGDGSSSGRTRLGVTRGLSLGFGGAQDYVETYRALMEAYLRDWAPASDPTAGIWSA